MSTWIWIQIGVLWLHILTIEIEVKQIQSISKWLMPIKYLKIFLLMKKQLITQRVKCFGSVWNWVSRPYCFLQNCKSFWSRVKSGLVTRSDKFRIIGSVLNTSTWGTYIIIPIIHTPSLTLSLTHFKTDVRDSWDKRVKLKVRNGGVVLGDMYKKLK